MNRTFVMAALALLAFAACGKRSDNNGGAGVGSGSPTGSGGPTGSAAPETPAAVALDAARIAELRQTRIDGFTCQPGVEAAGVVQLNCESATANDRGYKITGLITIQSCDQLPCQKMVLADWQKNENLKGVLSSVHLQNPDLVWQVDEIDLGGGQRGILTYDLSFVAQDGSTSTANGGNVYFNNGKLALMIMLGTRGGWPSSLDELKASVSKDEFIAAARQQFAAFAPLFR